jgi:hypothetical protein
MSKVDALIKTGYMQVSAKHRLVAKLPDGMTGLEACKRDMPQFYETVMDNAERLARSQWLRCANSAERYREKLTVEEFAEFKNKGGEVS